MSVMNASKENIMIKAINRELSLIMLGERIKSQLTNREAPSVR